MNAHELQTLPKPATSSRDREALRRYREDGRAAVRGWLTARVRGPDPDAEMAAALRLGLAPSRLVALWVEDDLFDDPALELAARAGYPELAPAFAALDAERRGAAVREQEARAERDLRRALNQA